MLALLVPQAPSVSSLFVSIFVRPSCLYMTGLGALDVRHGVAAGTQRQSVSATRTFSSDFNTVCLLCLSCCLLLV